jgi:CBS domain-containing protein
MAFQAPKTTSRSNGYNLDDLLLAMTRTRISDVVDADQWWKGQYTVFNTTSLSDAFENIVRNDIHHGCPVLNDEGRYIGWVTLMDLIGYVLDQVDFALPVEKFDRDFFRQEVAFINATVAQVRHRAIRKETHPNASLYHAFENLAQFDEHHMAVLDPNNNVQGVFTQKNVFKWVQDNLTLLGNSKSIPISELRPYKTLITINQNRTAHDAFKAMRDKNIHAIPVTDYSGKLVDVISTTDFKGIVPGNEKFRNLWLTCKEFKNQVRKDYAGSPQFPKVVDATDTLEDVLRKYDIWDIHRVFVVDSPTSLRVTDVISMTDVLDYLWRESKQPSTVPLSTTKRW